MSLAPDLFPDVRIARARRRRGALLAAGALVWTVLFFAVPTAVVVVWSVMRRAEGDSPGGFSVEAYWRFIEQDYFWRALVNSLEVTALVTVLSILVAYPVAYVIAFHVPERWRRPALALAVLPFWTSYIVRSYAWLLVLAPNGVVNQVLLAVGLVTEPIALSFNTGATVLGFVHFFAMLCLLTIYASLVRINPRLLLAARDLGASGMQTFARVVLPLSVPGVAAGAFLTIVVTMGDYVTPQILGGNTELLLSQTILMQIQRRADIPMAAALSVIMLATIAVAYLVLARRLAPHERRGATP